MDARPVLKGWAVTVSLAAAALLLLGAAGVLHGVLATRLLRPPATLDRTVVLQGTASYTDTTALRTGDLQALYRRQIPVTINDQVRTVRSEGPVSVVQETWTVLGPDQKPVRASTHTFTLDRTTMLAAVVPPNPSAPVRQALALGFPPNPQPVDYPFWDVVTQTVAKAAYQGTEVVSGRRAYRYLLRSGGPVTDPQVRTALPGDLLVAPTSTTLADFWVDSLTSVVLRLHYRLAIQATQPGAEGTLPPVPVFSVDARLAPIAARVALAEAVGTQDEIFLVGTAAPVALLGLGALAAAATLARLVRHLVRATSRRDQAGVRLGPDVT